jgi:spoIIIJ-associated protein
MSSKKKDFYGKEVTDAIKKACDEFGMAQEQLDIEVVETGSMGIFGLIRKKAHIRAALRAIPVVKKNEVVPEIDHSEHLQPPMEEAGIEERSNFDEDLHGDADERDEIVCDDNAPSAVEAEQVSQENLEIVKAELVQLLKLMGYPSEVHIESSGISVHCCITGGFEEALTGQDGKTLDSLQYLLRKIIARKISDRLRLSIDIGDFRERRQQELAEKAVELARMVKEDGKTQIIAALNPSERRVVHMTLQEDKEIRSRSVGEGLFKKILIYKPGKGKKGGPRKQSSSRGHRPKKSKADTEEKNSEE